MNERDLLKNTLAYQMVELRKALIAFLKALIKYDDAVKTANKYFRLSK